MQIDTKSGMISRYVDPIASNPAIYKLTLKYLVTSNTAASFQLVGIDLTHHKEGHISTAPVASVSEEGVEVLILHYAFP